MTCHCDTRKREAVAKARHGEEEAASLMLLIYRARLKGVGQVW